MTGDVVSVLFVGAVICLAWWLADRIIKWADEEDDE